MSTRNIVYVPILVALSLPVTGAEVVREFSGSGAATTAEFEVEAPWILDWRVNSEYQKSMAIEVHLPDGDVCTIHCRVAFCRYISNGASEKPSHHRGSSRSLCMIRVRSLWITGSNLRLRRRGAKEDVTN